MRGVIDGSQGRPAWWVSVVAGLASIGLAAWTVVAIWLNVFFVDGFLRTFYDPQGYEQERDALRQAAVALYTAGDHVGHGLAVCVGLALGLQQRSVRATLVTSAAAGLVLAVGQGVVAATLTVPRLQRWGERGDYSFPATMLGDRVVLVPVLTCLTLYPLLAMLGAWFGLRRDDAWWPRRWVRIEAAICWSLAGPFYLLTLDLGAPVGVVGWALVVVGWLVPLGCLVLALSALSAAPPTDCAPAGGVTRSRVPR